MRSKGPAGSSPPLCSSLRAAHNGVMNTDILAFNPAPIIAVLVVIVTFAVAYSRTRSAARAGLAVLAAIGVMVALVVVVHLLGFE